MISTDILTSFHFVMLGHVAPKTGENALRAGHPRLLYSVAGDEPSLGDLVEAHQSLGRV
jgi:hypothetical protein